LLQGFQTHHELILQRVETGKDPVVEILLTQLSPDMLNGIELRRIRR
jgi:predicted transcriptional regulator